ncbi:unnamed protein product [Laminaria digitata]
MCLGPDGFGACDPSSVWIMAYTNVKKKTKAIVSMLAPEPERMCLGSSGGMFSSLRHVGVSRCGSGNSKGLELADLSVKGHSGYFLAQGQNCLARAQGKLRSSADMQASLYRQLCKTGTPLDVVETSVHNAGMHVMTNDGFCFDGSRFRPCNDGDPTLRWGIGLDFRGTEPSRNMFCFYDQEKCAVREGEKVKKGDCNSKGAARWGWRDGKMSQGGSHCLGRARDNTALMVPCSQGYEHIGLIAPEIGSSAAQPTGFGEREKPSTRKPPLRRFEMQ